MEFLSSFWFWFTLWAAIFIIGEILMVLSTYIDRRVLDIEDILAASIMLCIPLIQIVVIWIMFSEIVKRSGILRKIVFDFRERS